MLFIDAASAKSQIQHSIRNKSQRLIATVQMLRLERFQGLLRGIQIHGTHESLYCNILVRKKR